MIHNDTLIGGEINSNEFHNELINQDVDIENNYPQDHIVIGNETMYEPFITEEQLHQIPTDDLIEVGSTQSSHQPLDSTEETLPIRYEGNTFPTLEQHDKANCNFQLHINQACLGKSGTYYSDQLKKFFTKMDTTSHIEVSYNDMPETRQVNLRAMVVFTDDISAPVKRCNNHKGGDLNNDIDCAKKESVIRSENSGVVYVGLPDGKNFNDRLSMLIPLSSSSDGRDVIKQSIALKFLCQNSCIGRKTTCVIFTLESKRGDILSKRILNVKVCSCPKRDKDKEEDKINEMKRSGDEMNCPPGKRVAKNIKIKKEPDMSPQGVQQDYTTESPSQDEPLVLTLLVPNESCRESILKIVKVLLESKVWPCQDACIKDCDRQLNLNDRVTN